LVGILFETTEESDTSKIDHLAGESMKRQDKYLGKRVKRGLFQSSIGKLLNADVNGSIGIGLKKVVCNSFVKIVLRLLNTI
jgi:putative transposase